jgi:uncharacterized protein (TIGR00661 family)
MKILYSVQATGNGHISRAMEILPYLQEYGVVDIFLSGANSSLELNTPVKYRSKGLSLFYTCNGSLNYLKTVAAMAPYRIHKEIKELPVENYDLVINDFECITAMACRYKKIPSVNFGHQASFMSAKTPRPVNKDKLGEWILTNYAPASQYIGLHFQRYDDFILPPVIKFEIRNAEPADKNHITVYLPAYCEPALEKKFHALADFSFQIFSAQTKQIRISRNIRFLPVDKSLFNNSLINCRGIITGAGFETPSEAMYLGKKLMVIPIKGQYEQQCNAAALEKMGVKKLDDLSNDFTEDFHHWINLKTITPLNYNQTTDQIINNMMKLAKVAPDHPEWYSPHDKIYPIFHSLQRELVL